MNLCCVWLWHPDNHPCLWWCWMCWNFVWKLWGNYSSPLCRKLKCWCNEIQHTTIVISVHYYCCHCFSCKARPNPSLFGCFCGLFHDRFLLSPRKHTNLFSILPWSAAFPLRVHSSSSNSSLLECISVRHSGQAGCLKSGLPLCWPGALTAREVGVFTRKTAIYDPLYQQLAFPTVFHWTSRAHGSVWRER